MADGSISLRRVRRRDHKGGTEHGRRTDSLTADLDLNQVAKQRNDGDEIEGPAREWRAFFLF